MGKIMNQQDLLPRYETPDGFCIKRSQRGNRWSFFAGYLRIVAESRKLALKGCFDDLMWRDMAFRIMELIEHHGGHFIIEGLDGLTEEKPPFVYVGNHMSNLETQILSAVTSPFSLFSCVVKESLTRGYYSPIMKAVSHIAVTRDNPGEDLKRVMEGGTRFLKEGRSLMIFPQTPHGNGKTREDGTFTPASFNSLGAKLAARAGCSLVPIAVKTDFWGNGGFFSYFGSISPEKKIHLSFGKALKAEGRAKAAHRESVEFITQKLQSLGVPIL